MERRRKLGARRYKDYDPSLLEVAVDLVANKNLTSYEAEKQFGIPRRTIVNKVKKKHTRNVGSPTRLTEEEENKIVSTLVLCGEYGSPLTLQELRIIVYDYLKKTNRAQLFDHKMPGEKWARMFIKRHKDHLTMRSTQNIKKARATKTSQEYQEYFDNLAVSLQGVKPECILNYDETNLTDNPGSQRCIFKKGTKYPNKVLNNSKTAISVMFAATADGTLLPPYVVYKADNLWKNWCSNGPSGTRFNKTKSGWFDRDTFEDWFYTIVLPWADRFSGSKVIIGDNLSSHLNINIISECQDKHIRFVFLPPNSTHDTQPLDVSFFRPLKRAWKNILLDYKMRHPSSNNLNKNIFPELLTRLIEDIKINQAKTITSGFCATGIYPLNAHKVLRKVPGNNSDIVISFDASLVQYLKDSRKPNSDRQKSKNLKLQTKPGESVATDDIRVTHGSEKKSKASTSRSLSARGVPTLDQNNTSKAIIDVAKNILISNNGYIKQDSSVHDDPSTSGKSVIISNILLKPADLHPETRVECLSDITNVIVENKKRKLIDDDTDTSCSITLHDSGDSIDEPFLQSNSDTETLRDSDIHSDNEDIEEELEEPDVGKYVVVKFVSDKSVKYYIGLIIEKGPEENCYSVKYLRKARNGAFSWPVADDISEITRFDVENILPKPQVGRRGQLKFNLNNLNVLFNDIY